jgi:hypothetical protein
VRDLCSFDYAVIRVVPRVERGEFVNAGVILYCPTRATLDIRIELDDARLAALDPALDLSVVRAHLAAMERVSRGGPDAGPIGAMAQGARFHWLTAPRSTILQTSPVHAGVHHDLDEALELLMNKLVRVTGPGVSSASHDGTE